MAPFGVDAVMVQIGHTFDILAEQIKYVTENPLAAVRITPPAVTLLSREALS